MDDKERLEKGQILARVIIEMLGAPKEHIEATLKNYVEKLKKEAETYDIIKADFEEAKEQGKFFAAFTELEIWFHKPADIVDFCFDSMPSSVDILRPDEMKLTAKQFTNVLNDLQAHLHQLDAGVKQVKAENRLLDANSTAVFRNFIGFMLKQGEKDLGEIGKSMGVVAKELKPFLDKLIEQGAIEEKDGKYHIKEKK